MNAKQWALEMALYNKWQNDGLRGHYMALPVEERRRDRGMYFRSIHQTVDHILLVDEALFEYATTGSRSRAFDPNRLVYADDEALMEARGLFDDNLLAFVREASEPWFDETLVFASERLEGERSLPRQFFFMQMFNHATHHRAQVTAELHKMGIDYGITDMPFNPHSQY